MSTSSLEPGKPHHTILVISVIITIIYPGVSGRIGHPATGRIRVW